ncbi:MAG: family 78 glycoside hydrolase catalytic domain [Spirochaetales bacterium]
MASEATPVSLKIEFRERALGIDTASPRFSWKMDDSRPGALQTAYRLQVSAGHDFADPSLLWNVEATGPESVLLPYAGAPLASRTRYFFRVAICDHKGEWSDWSKPSWFETAFLHDEWQANWIAGGPEEQGDTQAVPGEERPARYLRREFEWQPAAAKTAPSSRTPGARLYVAARGLVELYLNGRRVGADVLSPGWTDFSRRAQYLTYDVGDYLVPGRNVIGAVLGDGWYSGRIARVHDGPRIFGSTPQLLVELHRVGSADSLLVASDAEWEWTTGPILRSDIYDGEFYDARLELDGWAGGEAGDGEALDSRPASRDQNDSASPREPANWQPVRVVGPASSPWNGNPDSSETAPRLDAKLVPPPRRIKEISPLKITSPTPGTFIYDLGQNITGWARLAVSGKAGQTATLRFAEMLQTDGTLYTENLRSAIATDQYTFANDGKVSWEPTFTFHGFRFVELTGVDIDPDPSQITGIVVHNDLEKTGRFSCSHELLNQLQSNIEWGQRGNYLEAPTDCPQRDERLGWTGDAQVFIPTAAFTMNVAPFFEKWQRDLADSQGSAGTIPSVAPAIRYMTRETENDGGPAWSDAVVICPWTLYTRYGDTRVLEEHYESMRAFVDSMERRSRGLIRSDEFVVTNGGYGDWVSMDAPEGERVGATPKDLIGTAYFAYSTDLMRRIAALLGKRDDELELRDLHRRIVQAFRAEYVTAAGRLLGDTQTSYVLALAFDLLPEELRQPAVDRLVRKLERRSFRMTTGFVGTPLLCPVLTRFGRADVAYKLLQQEEFPSWLYTVKQGATTMWERWNSYTHEHGFGPVEMNSFNHYAYGSIGDWMYRSVAGLEIDFAAAQRGEPVVRIAPKPGYGLTQASAELDTPFGRAKSGWSIAGGRATLEVEVPANATAHVEIPAGTAEVEIDADEDEQELESLVIFEETKGGVFHFRVASGSYAFAWDCEAVVLPST